ncbi:MAG: hypothetical protein PWP46_1680 [Fusobacteriaceae bacterium]|jgi:hypothetical protein|nr:hypothetical protein [Fusobacteriales bacterium]MDN5304794.1 hypothetical protein [Fusobacteriaceae bacterium]
MNTDIEKELKMTNGKLATEKHGLNSAQRKEGAK